MSKRRVGAVIVLVLLLGLTGAGLGALRWWRSANRPVVSGGTSSGGALRVSVPKGASAASVGKTLEARGVIRSARAWRLVIARSDPVIQPGVYDLSPREAPSQILRHLVDGDVATNRATFPEGFTLRQIARRLQTRGILANENDFLALVTTRGNTLQASFPLPANLEGYLFPDTYKFPVGDSAPEIAQRMVDNFDRRVAQSKSEALRRNRRALAEIVTIASLIEREAQVPGDRARIAGVIYNRLARDMPLQIDATVQYAQGFHKTRLLFRDLEVDSPYNTYKVRGLPPGPICSPGMASLEAALAPERSSFLYYVARRDGSHVFGRTLSEHNHNIALVRRQARSGG